MIEEMINLMVDMLVVPYDESIMIDFANFAGEYLHVQVISRILNAS